MPTIKELEAKIKALDEQVAEFKSDNQILEEMLDRTNNPYGDKLTFAQ